MIKVAFYDTKAYDKPSFEYYGGLHGVEFKFLETKLTEDTVELAKGYDAVCVFVNDTVDAAVIDKLYEYGGRGRAFSTFRRTDSERAARRDGGCCSGRSSTRRTC